MTRHYYRRLRGEKTSTNPVATIFAWSGALRKRGSLDENEALVRFADALEQAVMDTIARGIVTADLACLMDSRPESVDSDGFLAAVRQTLETLLA